MCTTSTFTGTIPFCTETFSYTSAALVFVFLLHAHDFFLADQGADVSPVILCVEPLLSINAHWFILEDEWNKNTTCMYPINMSPSSLRCVLALHAHVSWVQDSTPSLRLVFTPVALMPLSPTDIAVPLSPTDIAAMTVEEVEAYIFSVPPSTPSTPDNIAIAPKTPPATPSEPVLVIAPKTPPATTSKSVSGALPRVILEPTTKHVTSATAKPAVDAPAPAQHKQEGLSPAQMETPQTPAKVKAAHEAKPAEPFHDLRPPPKAGYASPSVHPMMAGFTSAPMMAMPMPHPTVTVPVQIIPQTRTREIVYYPIHPPVEQPPPLPAPPPVADNSVFKGWQGKTPINMERHFPQPQPKPRVVPPPKAMIEQLSSDDEPVPTEVDDEECEPNSQAASSTEEARPNVILADMPIFSKATITTGSKSKGPEPVPNHGPPKQPGQPPPSHLWTPSSSAAATAVAEPSTEGEGNAVKPEEGTPKTPNADSTKADVSV